MTGTLAGFEPAAFQPRSPAPAPTIRQQQQCRAELRHRRRERAGWRHRNVAATGRDATFARVPSPALRHDQLQNTFAHESFIDEVAAAGTRSPTA